MSVSKAILYVRPRVHRVVVGMTPCPKVVTVFGRKVKLRGNIDAVRTSIYAPRGEAKGKIDGIAVQISRSHSGSFMVRVTIGDVADWKWSKSKVLNKAIAAAETAILKRLRADEEKCAAARKIVGRR